MLVPAIISKTAGAIEHVELAKTIRIPIPEGPMEGRTDKGYF